MQAFCRRFLRGDHTQAGKILVLVPSHAHVRRGDVDSPAAKHPPTPHTPQQTKSCLDVGRGGCALVSLAVWFCGNLIRSLDPLCSVAGLESQTSPMPDTIPQSPPYTYTTCYPSGALQRFAAGAAYLSFVRAPCFTGFFIVRTLSGSRGDAHRRPTLLHLPSAHRAVHQLPRQVRRAQADGHRLWPARTSAMVALSAARHRLGVWLGSTAGQPARARHSRWHWRRAACVPDRGHTPSANTRD